MPNPPKAIYPSSADDIKRYSRYGVRCRARRLSPTIVDSRLRGNDYLAGLFVVSRSLGEILRDRR